MRLSWVLLIYYYGQFRRFGKYGSRHQTPTGSTIKQQRTLGTADKDRKVCKSKEPRAPDGRFWRAKRIWIPAFAGMTSEIVVEKREQ